MKMYGTKNSSTYQTYNRMFLADLYFKFLYSGTSEY